MNKGGSLSEAELHVLVAAFLARSLPAPWRYSTFPAGGGGLLRGARLKAAGLARGWPDIMLLHPSGIWHGLELKSTAGKVRPDQVSFIEWSDGRTAVCRSLDQVERTLRAWGVPLVATTGVRRAA